MINILTISLPLLDTDRWSPLPNLALLLNQTKKENPPTGYQSKDPLNWNPLFALEVFVSLSQSYHTAIKFNL